MLSDALSVIFLLTFKMHLKLSVTLYTICIMLIPVTESWVCGVGAGPVIRASDVLTLLVISAENSFTNISKLWDLPCAVDRASPKQ